jgi:hypothetical protein
LWLQPNPAENRHDAQIRVLRVLAKAFLDLRRQLTRRCQYQHANAMLRFTCVRGQRRGEQIVNDWQCEACSFAGAGLGEPHQIPSRQGQRNCLLLDGSGLGVTGVAHRIQNFRNEFQILK